MSEKNNTEYTPSTQEAQVTQQNYPAADPAYYTQPVQVNTTVNVEIEEEEESKSNPNVLFGILCAVLAFAIAFTSGLSVFNVMGHLNSAPESTDGQPVNAGYNVYTEMHPKYAATKYPVNMASSFNKVYAANNDVVGWLYIPGTNVNTPVVQTKDNTKYLRYNFYSSNTNYGTTYADYRCKVNTLSTNTVLFGHNMPSGTHFYDVHRYENIEWYKTHPTIEYNTLYGSYTFLVCSVFYSTGTKKYDGGYFFNYIYPNIGPTSMNGYIEQITQRSIYDTGIDIRSTDKVITLSTCTHSLDGACGMDIDGRLVVVGRLLRQGESAEVDTSKAKSNPNYRRPQIWYDKTGKTNPYAKYVTWQPSQR